MIAPNKCKNVIIHKALYKDMTNKPKGYFREGCQTLFATLNNPQGVVQQWKSSPCSEVLTIYQQLYILYCIFYTCFVWHYKNKIKMKLWHLITLSKNQKKWDKQKHFLNSMSNPVYPRVLPSSVYDLLVPIRVIQNIKRYSNIFSNTLIPLI